MGGRGCQDKTAAKVGRYSTVWFFFFFFFLADDVDRFPSIVARGLAVFIAGQDSVGSTVATLGIVESTGLALAVPLVATLVRDVRTTTLFND